MRIVEVIAQEVERELSYCRLQPSGGTVRLDVIEWQIGDVLAIERCRCASDAACSTYRRRFPRDLCRGQGSPGNA